MLTAVLLAYDAPAAPLRREAAARSLGSLVEACVQGLVADAALVGAPDCGLERIADEAGCALVKTARAGDGLAEALAMARRDHILLLLAGYAVERGFVEEIEDLFAYDDRGRARILRLAPHSLLTRLAPNLSRPVGLIAAKSALAEAGAADLSRLARKLRGAELTTRARRVF